MGALITKSWPSQQKRRIILSARGRVGINKRGYLKQ